MTGSGVAARTLLVVGFLAAWFGYDVWIVSQNRHGDGTWATTVDAKSQSIEHTCAQITSESAAAMACNVLRG